VSEKSVGETRRETSSDSAPSAHTSMFGAEETWVRQRTEQEVNQSVSKHPS
jgi:hypothetical protein